MNEQIHHTVSFFYRKLRQTKFLKSLEGVRRLEFRKLQLQNDKFNNGKILIYKFKDNCNPRHILKIRFH